MTNIAIIGSRKFNDFHLLNFVMINIIKKIDDEITIISGGALGADTLGKNFAAIHKYQFIEHLPDWNKYGKAAGFMRNSNIIESSNIVVCFWDGLSKGTLDSIRKAKKLNKQIINVDYTKLNDMKIMHIVAVDKNNCIGGDNKLLWRQSEDLKNFKRLTTDKTVLMGRKTFESMGSKALPKRVNIVVSRSYGNNVFHDNDKKVIFCGSIESGIAIAKTYKNDLFIIGGGEIYKQTLPIVDEIYLTEINTKVEGDTFYPEIGLETRFNYVKTTETYSSDEKNQHEYRYIVYKNKK